MNTSSRGTLHFALAVGILVVSTGYLMAGKKLGWLVVIKKALPIRKPLDDMDQKALAPWKLVSAGRLSAENEGEVGTKEYLTWSLVDPNGTGERRRQIHFTAFYYTGVQDQVPHVGEECLLQGGLTQAAPKEIFEWEMPTLGQKAELGRVMFDDPKHVGVRLLNYYTISVNGEFKGDRNDVRVKMVDPRDTHLYYCKVDVSIQSTSQADLAELDAIAKEVLDKGIAELVRSHWPLKGWERGGPREVKAAKLAT
ncbi:MAG: hypothetical protein AABZ08_04560 [Planctomycetota bacterium]